ncbi:uncharacterized protein EAE97_004105 [Botrytis byssoidea]|uniref:Uncharacterized protein n=1 Tax=Botrytis byssoidea TaxID=139641 RepID=A0A9P5ISA6_9HELO|nr:uncharacterized protein EAE97_004105 [Botrytis byssoidea]KAF7946856.1 hypothetical protein EAE97_004105 [Botrytis byssoidea]
MSERLGYKFVLTNPDELEHCLLCNRIFCARHKAVENNTVCQIDHRSYYRTHQEFHDTGTIFRNMEHRNIEMDPSKAGLNREAKSIMEVEAMRQRREGEEGRI